MDRDVSFKEEKKRLDGSLADLALQFSHVFHREITCVGRCISASDTSYPDRTMNHKRGLEEFLFGFFYSKEATVSLSSMAKQRDDEERTGLPKASPSRSHLFAGTTGNLEQFTQDLACLGDDGGRHDDAVWDGWRSQMEAEIIDETGGR